MISKISKENKDKEPLLPNQMQGVWAIALCSAAAAIAISFLLIPAFFGTNDDAYAQQIFSGGVSGQPTAYLRFVNFALGWFVSLLFTIVPTVPWWVVTHLVFLLFAISTIGHTLICLKRQRLSGHGGILLEFIGLTFLSCGLFLGAMPRLQFTSTASLLMAAAIFSSVGGWAVHGDADQINSERTDVVVSVLCGVLGFAMRQDSGIIGLIFWALAAVGVLALCEGSLTCRFRLAKAPLTAFSIAVVGFFLLNMTQIIAWSSQTYRETMDTLETYSRFTDVPHPAFEADSKRYEAVGWDSDLFRLAYQDWYSLDERVNSKTLEMVNNDLSTIDLTGFVDNPLQTLHGRMGFVLQPASMAYICLGLAASCIAASVSKSRWYTRAVWAIYWAVIFCMGYLLLRSRLLERTAYSVLFPATAAFAAFAAMRPSDAMKREAHFTRNSSLALVVLSLALLALLFKWSGATARVFVAVTASLLLTLLVRELRHRVRDGLLVIVFALLSIALCLAPAAGVIRQYGWSSDYYYSVSRQQRNTEAYYAYVRKHPDQFFFSAYDANFTTTYIFGYQWPENQTGWGGWRYYYPWFEKAMREQGFDGVPTSENLLDKNVRVVFGSNESLELMVRYLSGLFGPVKAQLKDTIGDGLRVYRFVRQ